MDLQVDFQVVADTRCLIGEGPIWHPVEKRIYWTDIDSRRLYRYDPVTGDHAPCDYEGQKVGGFTIQTDGTLLLFREKGNIVVWREGGVQKTIVESIPGEENHRFNDVWADPEGRVFCGVIGLEDPAEKGRLYRLDRDGSLTVLVDGVDVANGMGLTRDGTSLYFTESLTRTIWLFDYERATGALTNQRPFTRVPEDGGFPDGMAVDEQGRVWSARWDGWCVTCVGDDGNDVQTVKLPAQCVSSACFGGDDLSQMYVTSAGGDDRKNKGEHAGSLIRIDIGVRGAPEYLSRIGL